MNLNIYKNALLITGETKENKEKLKELGGKYNNHLQGWIFIQSVYNRIKTELGDKIIDNVEKEKLIKTKNTKDKENFEKILVKDVILMAYKNKLSSKLKKMKEEEEIYELMMENDKNPMLLNDFIKFLED